MKFKLEIELGTDAMQTPADVAEALRRLANIYELGRLAAEAGEEGRVRDANGNTVGRWEVVEE